MRYEIIVGGLAALLFIILCAFTIRNIWRDKKMASEKRMIDVTPENIKAVLKKVPYYPDEIWKFTAMTERFPTVDAVEVVRCKDCKHLTVYNSPTLYAYCQKTHLRFEPFQEDTRTHFCSYGERKTVSLEDIVDLNAQTKANNEAMRKAIDFILGDRKDNEKKAD